MDGHLHRRIGEVIDTQGDKSDAIQYYYDVNCFIDFQFDFYFFDKRLIDIIHVI
jgi:hypothetical protein